MIARRLGALVLAIGLVVGAWMIRSNVLDGDSTGNGDRPAARTTTVVCVPDLAAVCRTAFGQDGDIDLVVEDVDATLDRLATVAPAEAPTWVTLDPFPAVAAELRRGARQPELTIDSTTIASSPMALVVAADRIGSLVAACSDPVDWRCLGELAGDDWSTVDPAAAPGTVRPGFASQPGTAIGQLGTADAVTSYFADAPVSATDPAFVAWARPLADAVDQRQLQGRSAVTTIQVRRSLLDIAVGVEADLGGATPSGLDVAYAASMMRADVVIAIPSGVQLPSGAVDALRGALSTNGWSPPATGASHVPSPAQMLAVQQVWDDLT